MVERKLLQRVLVGGRRAAGRFPHRLQPLLLEQDLLDLLRRIQVERLPGLNVRPGLDLRHLVAELT